MRVMGVVNVTPDSFVAEVRTPDLDAAVGRCRALVEAGAEVIDIGGESTRPGADVIEPEVEAARVVPIVAAFAAKCPDHVLISVDTRSADVARAAVEAGATMINDMSAQLYDVAGELGVAYVAAHMQGDPQTMQQAPSYTNVVAEVREQMLVAAQRATDAGSPAVWIDPGIGFGKTDDHNLALLANIDAFARSGFPVLIGVSRKGMIGRLHAASDESSGLGSVAATPTADRHEASLALAVWSLALGADMVRTHDVAETAQAVKVLAGAPQQA